MRQALLPTCLIAVTFAAACAPISIQDERRLASYQRNAALYFEGGKLDQAMLQIDRGLEIEPDDYKLSGLKGAVLVRATSNNPKIVDEAAALLEQVYDWRSSLRHEPYVLFYYALARQRQGLRALGNAIRAEDRELRSADAEQKSELGGKAREAREQARLRLQQADELLDILVERGEMLRLAHKHKLQIARQTNSEDDFETSANAFLEASTEAQESVRTDVETTTVAAYEQERIDFLRDLEEEELEVRALFADWLYDRQRLEDAVEQINVVLERDPKRTPDYYNRGRVLLELKRFDAAKQDFRRFLATSTMPAASEQMTFAAKALKSIERNRR
ncbi:MAG: hypothetical protein AB8H80_19815 [Planctomycetota bacterium]